MERARLLIADDELQIRETYGDLLAAAGHEVETASDGDEAIEKLRARPYDLLLTDLVFPPDDGIEVLKQAKRIRPSTLVVLFSGFASVEQVLHAFRAGAYDFLEKPVPRERLLELVDRALDIRKLGAKRRQIAEELETERLRVMQLRQELGVDDPFAKLVGISPVIRGFVDTLREVARTDSTVLLTGESGTGKSLAARTIHEASTRRSESFVEANCVVYSEGVLHSELFGHERGAFTGAARTKRGRFELAHGGTLFLDEIGEIPAGTQLMLLRVLQERAFERVGGEETIDADVRLIAATNRDLQAAIRDGNFRSDLYYRLNVIPVHVPPLRDHAEDIPMLAQSFLARCARRLERPVVGFDDDAIDVLTRYAWPGNVRELENTIERLLVLARGETITVRDLPEVLVRGSRDKKMHEVSGTLQEMEADRIRDALHEAAGNKKLAAARLGIHRSTLYAKMRRYGLMEDASDGACPEERQPEEELATQDTSR